MTPSQHIKLIIECKDTLVKGGWNLANLTLDQFEIPMLHKSEMYSDMLSEDYFVARLGKVDEDKLIQLAEHLGLRNTPNEAIPPGIDIKRVIQQIDALKALMISVATGGEKIQNVNGDYRELRSTIAGALSSLGIADPNSFGDLWSWYNKWKDGSLVTYASRRAYIAELYTPLLDNLEARVRGNVPVVSTVPVTKAEPPTNAPIELFEEDNPEPAFEVMQRRRLRDFLEANFDLQELESLTFDLGINHQVFRHQTVPEFVIDLITYCQRRSRLSQLEKHAQSLRPTDWLSTSESRAHDIKVFTEGETIWGESHWLKLKESDLDTILAFHDLLKDLASFSKIKENSFFDPDLKDRFLKYIAQTERLVLHMAPNTSQKSENLLLDIANGFTQAISIQAVTKYAYDDYRQTVKVKLGV